MIQPKLHCARMAWMDW